jgi:hypothetical protein
MEWPRRHSSFSAADSEEKFYDTFEQVSISQAQSTGLKGLSVNIEVAVLLNYFL